MNLQELDRLLANYYNGETTAPEEELLLTLINNEELPPEYDADRQVVLGFRGVQDIPEPDSDFENRVMAAIDAADSRGRVVSLKRKIYSAVSVAATLLIVVSSYLILSNNSEPADTFDDPVLAYNATLEVLHQVSLTLNSGSEVLDDLSIIGKTKDDLVTFTKPVEIASREMGSLKYIDKSINILRGGAAPVDDKK